MFTKHLILAVIMTVALSTNAVADDTAKTPGDAIGNKIIEMQSKSGFTFKEDVVVDNKTGLMWTRSANISDKKLMTWQEAMQWVKNLNYGGYSDWKLPNKDELLDFFKRGGDSPDIYFSMIGFTNIDKTQGMYWPSTVPAFQELRFYVTLTKPKIELGLPGNSFRAWPVRNNR